MAKSLADQLLGAGLVDQKKVQKAKQEKRKETRQQHKSKTVLPDETQVRLAQERAEKAERDRKLNLQRVEAEQQKAMRAQVKQMLEHSGITISGEIRFNFTDPRNKKIKQMYVSKQVQEQLASGLLAICADGQRYILVPRNIADKIAERFADAIIFLADKASDAQAEDDPYKDYPVPDDLMW
jgi:uncharacterized protein